MANLSTQLSNLNLNSGLKWFQRPTDKCDGNFYTRRVKLLVNWFKFTKKIYDRDYFEYEVKMYKIKKIKDRKTGKIETKESEIPPPERTDLFWRHLRHESRKNAAVDFQEYVFDGKDTMYSINKTQQIISEMEDPKNQNIKYLMKINLRLSFRLNFSRENPMDEDMADRSYKFLKVVTTQKVRYSPEVSEEVAVQFVKNFVYDGNSILRVPESFYDPNKFEQSLEIAPRIEAWMGIYIGIKELFDGEPVLNFGRVQRLFMNAPKMSLLDYLLLIVDPETSSDTKRNERKKQLKEGNLTIKTEAHKRINQYLSGLKLKSAEVWDDIKGKMTERHLTYQCLYEKNAHEVQISRKIGRGREARTIRTPLFKVYEDNRKSIEFPFLPLVTVKSGQRDYYAPMEHLEFHENPTKYKGRIDRLMQDKFIKAATRKPHKYKEETIQMLQDLDFTSDELNFVKKFELSTDLKMIACPGKVLKEPKLVNRENNPIKMTPVIRGFQEKQLNVVPEKELCCALFVIRGDDQGDQPCLTTEDATLFYKYLIDGCVFRGMRIGEHGNIQSRSILYDARREGREYGFYPNVPLHHGVACFKAAARDAKSMFEDLPDKDQKVLLFIVISDPRLEAYGFIKHFCDVTLGVASQYVKCSTAQRAIFERENEGKSKKIFLNLALKINGKLGGVNQELDYSISAEMTLEEKERRKTMPLTMYVGIDVTHPTANSGIDYSIAAIVASINSGGTLYRNRIVVQQECEPGNRPISSGKEMTDILENKFLELLREFAEHNDNRLPNHIVVYRDGVSDSEMLRTSHLELKTLKSEVQKFLEERGQNEQYPNFTYIIIQKRHKTRLFRKIDDKKPEDKEEAKMWEEDMKESENTGIVNPSSGTTVDKVIVSKYKYDFFLSSHHGDLGTSRPGHYTVMYDDMNMTQDHIYKMTYELAFLSARCRKPISLPAPVHYAHLSCEKAKELYKNFKYNVAPEELPRKPTRHDVEMYLQTNNQYPGMSFA